MSKSGKRHTGSTGANKSRSGKQSTKTKGRRKNRGNSTRERCCLRARERESGRSFPWSNVETHSDCQVDRCSRHVYMLHGRSRSCLTQPRRSCGEWVKDRGGTGIRVHQSRIFSIIPVFILLPRFSLDCAFRRRATGAVLQGSFVNHGASRTAKVNALTVTSQFTRFKHGQLKNRCSFIYTLN